MDRAGGLIKNASSTPNLRYIVVLNGYQGSDLEEAMKNNIKIISYEELLVSRSTHS
jgi:hypothetical protein